MGFRITRRRVYMSVRGLVLVYILLCVLTVLFSRSFFIAILQDGRILGTLPVLVIFSISLILMAFLVYSVVGIFRDYIAHRTGSLFQIRLLGYFAVTVLCVAAPATIIINQSANAIVRFWYSIRLEEALHIGQSFALDAYTLHLEKFEERIGTRASAVDARLRADWQDTSAQGADFFPQYLADELGEEILAVQDFFLETTSGTWVPRSFAGLPLYALSNPPGNQSGFAPRDTVRDRDCIRYLWHPQSEDPRRIRVFTFSLGAGFDEGVELLDEEQSRIELINALGQNVRPLLLLYYGIFLFPTLLMTVIIGVSFSQRVTQPLIDLAEATHRVAEGDFSIQMLAKPGDELALLVNSFNTMVRDLERSQNTFLQEEKFSMWKTLAEQLAHEIKNPLTPIQLSAERVLRRWKTDPEGIGEVLESSMLAILAEVGKLLDLLTNFRSLSQPVEAAHQSLAIRETLLEIISPYQSSHPAIRFETAYIQPDIHIRIDRRHFTQILTNLIMNAIVAMDGTGLIEMRTDLVSKRESRYCRLSIRDTGKGIPRQHWEQIFSPYFTTTAGGTGLGLPIVERIITDNGGSIWFDSGEGLGTIFYIDLPLGKPAE